MGRGPTNAVKLAQMYLEKNPETSAKFLAVKFGIDTSTIYRSDFWKDNQERLKQQQEKSV